MPARDFRSVEYYRIMKDNSWDTQFIMVPFEIPYEHCVDYIWNELTELKLSCNIQNISICNFPEAVITVTG